MKIIREPLLNKDGIDFGTGKFNKKAFERQSKEFNNMYNEQKQKANKRVKEKAIGNKIFVEGLGMCNI